ncbi:MAG TPA: 2-amino-4-hydroxy-6-hydroxymethyldihydropteridine diphosphokinase [Tepidisphaeraceae bacterium]|jgi:2-amino-4-hydroxy-6-hydroxymethyldihydropteridine diphosphokinase
MTGVLAYIALGANTGDRRENIRAALERMRESEGVEVLRVSSLIENAAVGGPEGSPAFLNGVVEVRTTLTPRRLLDRLLEIEHELGRVRREKWGPRPIDLDIVLFGDRVIDEEGLKVPHPLMQERRFVLEPLAEVAPEVVHPGQRRTARQMLNELHSR